MHDHDELMRLADIAESEANCAGQIGQRAQVIRESNLRTLTERLRTLAQGAKTCGVREFSAWVGDMKTSAGMDYYVCVGHGKAYGEYMTPNAYKIRGRAEYDVASWNHLFGHCGKPDILAYDTDAPPPAAQHEGSAVERTGTVADISDEELLRRAVFNLARPGRRSPREFAWTRIMDVFGLGSTYSTQLCRRFKRDPDTGKPIAPQPKTEDTPK